jgi:peptide-methionine (S)-S-oxide reductase
MSPHSDAPADPNYRAVCSGTTGHIEVLQMRFDNRIASFEDIVKFLFTFHDPTTKDAQEHDQGT